MPNLDWILAELTTPAGAFGHHSIPFHEFIARAGLDEEAGWLAQCEAWGTAQTPRIRFGRNIDGSAVLIKRE